MITNYDRRSARSKFETDNSRIIMIIRAISSCSDRNQTMRDGLVRVCAVRGFEKRGKLFSFHWNGYCEKGAKISTDLSVRVLFGRVAYIIRVHTIVKYSCDVSQSSEITTCQCVYAPRCCCCCCCLRTVYVYR